MAHGARYKHAHARTHSDGAMEIIHSLMILAI